MCIILNYAFCTKVENTRPPKPQFVECKHRQRLAREASQSGPHSIEEQRLINHLNHCQRNAQTVTLHIGPVLPPGTCIPDATEFVRDEPSASQRGGNWAGQYFRRCDGFYVDALGNPQPSQRLAFELKQRALLQGIFSKDPVQQGAIQQGAAKQDPVQQNPPPQAPPNQGRDSTTVVEVLPESPPREGSQQKKQPKRNRPRQGQSSGSKAGIDGGNSPLLP